MTALTTLSMLASFFFLCFRRWKNTFFRITFSEKASGARERERRKERENGELESVECSSVCNLACLVMPCTERAPSNARFEWLESICCCQGNKNKRETSFFFKQRFQRRLIYVLLRRLGQTKSV